MLSPVTLLRQVRLDMSCRKIPVSIITGNGTWGLSIILHNFYGVDGAYVFPLLWYYY
jgi:hypothetical protein